MKYFFGCVLLVGACSGDAPPPDTSSRAAPLPVEEGVLRLAGSGAMGPMARALSATFADHPANVGHLRPIVEDSIGSGGGVRAVSDGAVDIGMISRPLTEAEQRLGLTVVPMGADVVVLAANPELPTDDLPSEFLLDLYSGTKRTLLDGSPVTVLLRDPGESANLALDYAVPGMKDARERGYHIGFRVIYRDEGMAAALFGTRNSVGLSSLPLLAEARVPLKVLRIDGRVPSVEALGRNEWSMARRLWMVVRPERLERARPLLDFARSAAGCAIITAARYLPPCAPEIRL